MYILFCPGILREWIKQLNYPIILNLKVRCLFIRISISIYILNVCIFIFFELFIDYSQNSSSDIAIINTPAQVNGLKLSAPNLVSNLQRRNQDKC